MPKNISDIYETLRDQFLNGSTKPEGLSVIFYHGVLRGLQIITMRPTDQIKFIRRQELSLNNNTLPSDSELIQLLANMISHQSEIMHVY